jgi:hypothetical protein
MGIYYGRRYQILYILAVLMAICKLLFKQLKQWAKLA